MGKRLFFMLFIFICGTAHGKSFVKTRSHPFDLGVKGGLNSIKPFVHSFQIDDVDVQGLFLQYRVGYSVKFFTRLNFGRFFLQPAFSWDGAQCDFFFEEEGLSDHVAVPNLPHTLQLKSFSIPFSFGYYLVKERPYALSFRSGTKMTYRYDVVYMSKDINYLRLGGKGGASILSYLSLFSALEVEIGMFIFDISYEFGLKTLPYRFEQKSFIDPPPVTSMLLRLEGLSMSVGILF